MIAKTNQLIRINFHHGSCRRSLQPKLISIIRKQSISMNGIEREVGRQAANHFLESMEKNNMIDTPTICVSDPANAKSWEWHAGLDCKPKLTKEELLVLARGSIDPFDLVQDDLGNMSAGIKDLLGSSHPVLVSCAKYFFELDGGKKIRPAMVLAVSYALNGQNKQNNSANNMNDSTSSLYASVLQKRLAEITEMIHTASLFHDDVIDKVSLLISITLLTLKHSF